MNNDNQYWEKKDIERRISISYAQSWNLASSMITGFVDTDEVKKKMMEKWQEWFYEKLMANPAKEKLQAKKELAEKKKQEFVAELEI